MLNKRKTKTYNIIFTDVEENELDMTGGMSW